MDFYPSITEDLLREALNFAGRITTIKPDEEEIILLARKSVLFGKNTTSVIDWFNNIHDKQRCSFTSFDIVDFYPSITEDLLREALNFAGRITTIKPVEEEIILLARKSLLFGKNTTSVIDWFNNIHDKQRCSFTSFDIVDFYPSITEDLLREALNFAGRITTIKPDEEEIILLARKSLLFGKNTTSVIDWFNNIHDKQRCSFTSFDIVDFYPSITEDLLREALNFAGRITTIKPDEEEIILLARKSLLFGKNTTSVIDWFNNIHDKQRCSFTSFDIVDFYPSITEDLL